MPVTVCWRMSFSTWPIGRLRAVAIRCAWNIAASGVRIESAAGGGEQFDGDCAGGLVPCGGAFLDGLLEGGTGGAEVAGAAGQGGVVGGGGAGLEVARAGEFLGKQGETDDLAIAGEEAAFGLGVEEDAREAGDRERIGNAGEQGEYEQRAEGDEQV